MSLAEFKWYMEGYELREKRELARSILTGYYSAYYINGGKKSKNPNDLIKKMFSKTQSMEEGLKQIEQIKNIEKGG